MHKLAVLKATNETIIIIHHSTVRNALFDLGVGTCADLTFADPTFAN